MNLAATQPAVKNPYAPPRRDTPKADTLQAPSEPIVPPTRKLEAVTATRPEPAVISTRLEPAVSPKPHAESHDVNAAPASLWRRTFAWILDLAVISLVVGGFFGAALAVIGKPSLALLMSVAVPALGVVGFVAFVYTTLFAFLWKGRTPGRRLLGIQLVDSTGQAPGAVRALIRAGLSLASFGLFLSGFWLALFDRKGQTLHDKLTSTFVVRLRPAA